MLINILSIVIGIVLVLWGADRLTDGSVAVAERLGIPQIVIGLTIVAMGTSMPEFCSSLVSALHHQPGMAVGNVVGSNIFNALLIVGAAAVVAPISILRSSVKKDIPFALVASMLLVLLCGFDGKIQRYDAAILLVFFAIFMYMTLREAKTGSAEQPSAEGQTKPMSRLMAAVWIVVGLACLIGGSTVFVNGASELASALGVDPTIIGLTIVAMGTSLPELATSVVSATKGNSGIAIGNVLGSNVFNILFILGVTGVISPLDIQGITPVDLSLLVVSMVLLWLFSYTKLRIERWEGAVLIAVFAGYMTMLIVNA
ncbi:calcium/sodium antiporter [Prevotella lacticifex]|uniref:K+-dependent Na+/Ca+ exchanger n=1 Tax=Prevotella lacticifex TaxID=2854755 RepID=A0A9R1CVT6_9BACT|nr:calcium/sodium antiporter [Prevotella lacticifex]GJG35190.1 K+-dependent Na+/Ca+ exchanger [Prevotella lacticifex]GJG39759.1 K+-dependent Na+/Ca+ exchanger [Prevotella lacticifex]GJG41559.1 K+-dependent Na+/Ca+ exchanger [Prevotella lacticifex]GJG46115.1 K+-dependent Na+/Ca+ exchanger [Prevotella lacticifex]GJG47910.1 K+-dependent Na+/Ca+ exchanger [Prevotella lacticifex]